MHSTLLLVFRFIGIGLLGIVLLRLLANPKVTSTQFALINAIFLTAGNIVLMTISFMINPVELQAFLIVIVAQSIPLFLIGLIGFMFLHKLLQRTSSKSSKNHH